jgi:hypothetical protein
MPLQKIRRGRPRKFGRPSRPITVTLPEDIILRLNAVDGDLGAAIVRLAERLPSRAPRRTKPAELAAYGRRAVILVRPVRALGRIPGVQLVPVSHGRALIALDHPHGISEFELQLRDALDKGAVPVRDRNVLEAVIEILRNCRLSHDISVAERSIIVLENRRKKN